MAGKKKSTKKAAATAAAVTDAAASDVVPVPVASACHPSVLRCLDLVLSRQANGWKLVGRSANTQNNTIELSFQ